MGVIVECEGAVAFGVASGGEYSHESRGGRTVSGALRRGGGGMGALGAGMMSSSPQAGQSPAMPALLASASAAALQRGQLNLVFMAVHRYVYGCPPGERSVF